MPRVAIIGGGIGGLTAANALSSRWAAWRRDLLIAWRRRVHPGDPEGRGAAWLADYDASSPDVLADGGPASPGSTTAVG